MLSRFLIFAFALSSQSIFAAGFFVSEVYANSLSRSDAGKQWIEIATLSTPLNVTHLGIEIRGKDNTVQFSHDAHLLSVVFKDFLLIAASDNLGLSSCLKQANVVVIPEFAFNYRTAKSLCVTINEEQECVNADFVKVAAGTSVYRDKPDEPLLRHEPCFLVDNIFATPSKPSRYCVSSANMKEQILTKCNAIPALGRTFSFKKLDAGRNKPPVIRHAYVEIHNNTKRLRVSFVDDNEDGPWVFTLCHAPKTSTKICHAADPPRQVFSESEIIVPLKSESVGSQLTVEVTDVFGAIGRKAVIDDGEAHVVRKEVWQPNLAMRSNHKSTLVVTLLDDEVPCNFVIERQLRKISQFSLIRAGEHVIDVPIHHRDFVVFYSSPKGHGKIALKNSAKLNAPSS